MNDELHPLDFAARQAAKAAERLQIQRELDAGDKSPAQIAREHQPFLALSPARARIRHDLVRVVA